MLPKIIWDSNLAKFHWFATSISVPGPLQNFAQTIAIWLSNSAQNLRKIGNLKYVGGMDAPDFFDNVTDSLVSQLFEGWGTESTQFNGLMQSWSNSSALAMELCLFCTYPLIWLFGTILVTGFKGKNTYQLIKIMPKSSNNWNTTNLLHF